MKNKQKIRQKIAEKKYRRKVRSRIKHSHPKDTGPGYSIVDKTIPKVAGRKPMKKKSLFGAIKKLFTGGKRAR